MSPALRVFLLVLAITAVGTVDATPPVPALSSTTVSSFSTERTTTTNGTLTGSVTANDTAIGGVTVIAVAQSHNTFRLVRAANGDLLRHTHYPPVTTLRTIITSPLPPGVYITTTSTTGQYSMSLPPGSYAVRAIENDSTIPTAAPGNRTTAPVVTIESSATATVDLEFGDTIISECFCPNITIGSASGESNETVTVPVTTMARTDPNASNSGVNVTGYRLNITYDSEVVQITSVTPGDFGTPDRTTISNENGWVEVVDTDEQSTAAPTLFKLQFKIMTNKSTETFPLLTSESRLLGPDGTPIEAYSSLEGHIIIRGTTSLGTQYDTNGNDQIDTTELLTAIEDWETGKLTTNDLLQVIDYWQTSEEV